MTVPAIDKALRRRLLRVQAAVWVLFYIFLILYSIQKWEQPIFGVLSVSIATITYLLAVYGNAAWLIPRYYKTDRKPLYFLISTLFVGALVVARMYAEQQALKPIHSTFYDWRLPHFSFVFITNFLAFLFGALLSITIDYLHLLRKQEEMKHQQLASELNLLKAQVQPHFLFNTLNNIYYLAYTKNEKTAEVVARLSDIMRYFVDEAPMERVPLRNEIGFLKNYIELEQIRMLHKATLTFDPDGVNDSLLIPPMLLIPLVENIFKHGIDKAVTQNEVSITLEQHDGYLHFITGNSHHQQEHNGKGGVGLTNLRKRLTILFGNDFTLSTEKTDHCYKAILKFPVA
ncbi:histidine kinase [Paraflavitalea sp. CAU 1676]|uniref:sensor histidine kinase n=1 Tax=Paraflavitalea sp. CAU 1676 TaxID=3032598 RepID=UPI0023DA1D3A|nr:histidine kinase [Paraflavitalea sp. CAU 1676]MDF2190071.1 histidine kinase [Paraflavitalea sp. CAU 1676]